MQNNHPNLTYAYHFLSETIILFLLVLPFLHHRFIWVPYGSYILTAVVVCIVFSILAKFTVSYLWYILLAPFLFMAFYLLDYPLVLVILFTGVFIWRYIDIRNEEAINRENNYMLITLGLIVVNSILIQDSRIFIYPFILFAIVIFGYIISHLVVVPKGERKQFDKRLSVYFICLLAAGAGLLFLLYDGIRFIIVTSFQGILDTIASVIAGLAGLFSFFEPQEMEIMEEDPEAGGENPAAEYWDGTEGRSLIEVITPYVLMAVSLLIVIILVLWIWKNRYSRFDKIKQNESVSYSSEELDLHSPSSSFSQWRNRLFNKPVHPVRKMVYQFERTAAKHQMGRRRSETIEAWLKRIGMVVDFNVYQKVRYADADVSESEAKELKEKIKKMENWMEQKDRDVEDGP
ncbi:hypothetical protein ACDX78_02755 [Virgibacillus oceani]